MPGLSGALLSAAETLGVFDRAIQITQNNVSNAQTPGFARERMLTLAKPFDPVLGLPGGVGTGEIQTARDQFAEQAVRRANSAWNRSTERGGALNRIELLFDARGTSGIPAAINQLFSSFSALSAAPNDSLARNNVIELAGTVAARFREASQSLATTHTRLDEDLRGAVDAVNQIASRIRSWNREARASSSSAGDPNREATLYSELENLSAYVDFTVVRQDDGSVSVLMGGGESPLVIGDRLYELSYSPEDSTILNAQGEVVNTQVTGGKLRGLLEAKTEIIPGYITDLNRLAQTLADRINTQLAAGRDASGNPGAALFTYNAANGAAVTIQAAPLLPSQLAAASVGALGGNGNALSLTELGNAAVLDELTFAGFYGALSGRVGRDLQAARQAADGEEAQLLQAKGLRDQISSVSLDEEAVRLMEYQRAYQATSKLIMVLDELTEATVNLIRR